MICRSCAHFADLGTSIAAEPGHSPAICDDAETLVSGCTCQHGAETPPSEPHDPQEQQP